MDFSTQLDSIYTTEQATELLRVLDSCILCGFKEEIVPHHLYPVLKPVFEGEGAAEQARQLRTAITKMPVMTLYSPYTLSEESAREVVEYAREMGAKNTLISFICKTKEPLLAIEWQGKYGEF